MKGIIIAPAAVPSVREPGACEGVRAPRADAVAADAALTARLSREGETVSAYDSAWEEVIEQVRRPLPVASSPPPSVRLCMYIYVLHKCTI